jgi:hypothetical protein
MRIHGVSIDYVNKMQGGLYVSVDELVEVKIHDRN